MARPRQGYAAANGEKLPGTTTIAGQLDKPALRYWAFKQGKLAEQGIIQSLYDKADEAKDAGTIAHDLFELYIRAGETLSERAVAEKYGTTKDVSHSALKALENAIRWLEDTKIVVHPHERPLVSEEYRYGGTPDATGRDSRGHWTLLDWKTGGTALYPEHALQLAAYRQLIWETESYWCRGAHLVKFRREGGGFAHFYLDGDTLDMAWAEFKLLLELYPLHKQLTVCVK